MKKIISAVAGIVAGSLWAIPVPSVQEITFSTQGADAYADGATVMDGECYALVWSTDGTFDGFNVDGTAKDANDKVIYIGNLAKGGQCGLVSFQIADGLVSGGFFDVWVLDTRVFDRGEVTQVGKQGRKVTVTYAAKATAASVQVASSATAPSTAAGVAGGAVAGVPTVDRANVPAPKITSIAFDTDAAGNEVVVLKMVNTVPGVNYAAAVADTPTMDGAKEGGMTSGQAVETTVIVPKTGDSGFFKGMAK